MNACAAGFSSRSRCQAMPTTRGGTPASASVRSPSRYGSTDSQEITAVPTPSAASPRIVPLSLERKTICSRSSGRPSRFSIEWTSRIWA
jgi:hypothetical protein